MKAQKKFTTNERLANLEKAVGELYFQFTTLLKAIKEDDNSAERLMEYENRWRSAIGRELNIGMRINEIFYTIFIIE